MYRVVAIAALFAITACGDDVAGVDAGPQQPDARPGCTAIPDPSTSWLEAYQREVVSRLTGATPLPDGSTLATRATAGERARTRVYLSSELDSLALVAETHDYGSGANIFARIGGAGNDVAIVGAHFDSVVASPGANDNATGVALVLAVARFVSELDCRERSVIVVFFDEEEVGLVGSQAFAAKLASDGTNVVAVHTVDQMGWDMDGDGAIELERADAGLAELYEAAAAAGGLSIPLTRTATGSTDHVSFRAAGFRAIGITEEFVSGDTTPFYHQPGDAFATVNFDYLASTSALVMLTIARVVTEASPAFLDVPAVPVLNLPAASCGHHGCEVAQR